MDAIFRQWLSIYELDSSTHAPAPLDKDEIAYETSSDSQF
jgi:hypothetical protein